MAWIGFEEDEIFSFYVNFSLNAHFLSFFPLMVMKLFESADYVMLVKFM